MVGDGAQGGDLGPYRGGVARCALGGPDDPDRADRSEGEIAARPDSAYRVSRSGRGHTPVGPSRHHTRQNRLRPGPASRAPRGPGPARRLDVESALRDRRRACARRATPARPRRDPAARAAAPCRRRGRVAARKRVTAGAHRQQIPETRDTDPRVRRHETDRIPRHGVARVWRGGGVRRGSPSQGPPSVRQRHRPATDARRTGMECRPGHCRGQAGSVDPAGRRCAAP